MIDLSTIRLELVRAIATTDAAVHVRAFSAWVLGDTEGLSHEVQRAAAASDNNMLPEQVAALGYGKACGLLTDAQNTLLLNEIDHFSGRKFFSLGRPLRVEIDGIALLGIALVVREFPNPTWLNDLLFRSAKEVGDNAWTLGLVSAARHLIGAGPAIQDPADLAFALAIRGIGNADDGLATSAWPIASQLPSGPNLGLDTLSVRLSAFDGVVARSLHVRIATPGFDDLLLALRGVPRAMKHWAFETKPRTPRSEIAVWHVENEYHVQALLWTILAPIFPDLEDEENLPSIGHKRPRVDLAVPSIRTLIEVKYMRGGAQSDFAKVIDEVAADASLYLSTTTAFDKIVAFVWDDSAHSEQHHELQSGLEKIKGVEAAVVVSRPGRMGRKS
ncbi:hypothetical protein DTW90_22780 [Neorhizobium sp. P12A]|uniref:PD-(D/E)XK nuclease domain-containing protein n=1 Tax=Rhizobium/Agrobacterium group TaxID=227290 RepID=UPI00104D16B8|nr:MULTISPECIES: hypothetical protein [Rhizobium/Agrobacterium group]KAA0695398.1 hypothetical protein DTW90_22780 [Neorhizobium sp. P12A]TCR76845.1 hypothetical protein EV561_119105 [Rhizobium sp. BK376]